MVDDSNRADGWPVSRRRMVALASAGALGSIAGCTGDSSSDSEPNESSDDNETNPENDEKSIEELIAEYRCPETGDDYDIVVAQDGSGDYETVQAAIDAIEPGTFDGTRVYIKEGRYKEKLELPSNRTDVTFIGESAENTVLTYDDHADKTDEHGDELGTSGSSSFFVYGPDFTAKNITFENAAPDVAQAVAIRIKADRAVFENCRFIGNQDTLYTYGRDTRQYFKDCYIEGDVDFIFGLATAFFEDCEIFCKDEGYIAAPAQPEEQEFGYVFKNCDVTGDAPNDSVYLGRPWEPYGQTVYLECDLGDHIRPVGWEPWDEPDLPDKTKTAYFAEYGNTGPGYTPEQRADWSHQLDAEEAAEYTLENVFDGWNPRRCLEGS